MSTPPCLTGSEKKHWWLTNRKIVYKYIKDARRLIASEEARQMGSAVNLLDAALALSPRMEVALELKARSLLYLRRFKDVADMLQDYIPSLRIASEDSPSASCSFSSSDKLLPSSNTSSSGTHLDRDHTFTCFSVSDLKNKLIAGLYNNCHQQGQWRYLVLGQACCHLGLMEDAMVLLQTGKRLASAASRRQSTTLSEDTFSNLTFSTPPRTDSDSINHLLSQIKLLIRRRTAALAALDAGLFSEAIRHLSKIVDGRRGTAPLAFQAECYMHRAAAYRSAGRIAESIADCNRTLALDPTCIQALDTRASLLETIRCLPDSLHDLEHLKLLYNSILRDRKLPGPAWKRHNVSYREIPGKLCALTIRIQRLKARVASGDTGNVDYYGLIGLRRGCSRSELERAHLLLVLRHKPDKAISFIDRCDFWDDCNLHSVKDLARVSALLLYRLLQKGYTSIMNTIVQEEEAAKKQRNKALQSGSIQAQLSQEKHLRLESEVKWPSHSNLSLSDNKSVFKGVFCRDIDVVGNLLSQAGFNLPIPVKYEALSC